MTPRQKLMINCLRTLVRECEEIIEFTVSPISGTDYYIVSRQTRPVHAKSIIYSKAWRVGPRGGTKIIYEDTII